MSTYPVKTAEEVLSEHIEWPITESFRGGDSQTSLSADDVTVEQTSQRTEIHVNKTVQGPLLTVFEREIRHAFAKSSTNARIIQTKNNPNVFYILTVGE